MCGEQVPERHAHLVDTEQRSISCACTACGLLFTRPGGRYRTVPDRVRHDPDAPLTGAEWAELGIPVGIAFFFVNSALGRLGIGAELLSIDDDGVALIRLANGHGHAGVQADVEQAVADAAPETTGVRIAPREAPLLQITRRPAGAV